MLSTSAQKTQTVARTGSLGSGPGTVGAFTLALRTLLENRSGSADAADQYPIVERPSQNPVITLSPRSHTFDGRRSQNKPLRRPA